LGGISATALKKKRQKQPVTSPALKAEGFDSQVSEGSKRQTEKKMESSQSKKTWGGGPKGKRMGARCQKWFFDPQKTLFLAVGPLAKKRGGTLKTGARSPPVRAASKSLVQGSFLFVEEDNLGGI